MTLQASVVICTYNRPAMLAAAVRSCLRDATRRGAVFEVVIADNSRDGHAATLVAGLAAEGHPVRAVPASPPNISIARNAGLRAAQAPLVAFLDDDLEVEPGWLDHFLDTMAATGADVAIGPVRPRFPGGAPAWDPDGTRFTRVLDQPTGAAIPVQAGAGSGFVVSTASSIWRAATCFADPAPFDPGFGASGGEDLDLFLRLAARGRRVVWCAEAGVRETIPASRTAARYQVLRAYSGAQVYTAAAVRHSAAPRRRAAGIMARGAVQAALGAAALPAAALLGLRGGTGAAARTMRAMSLLASGCGKLTWRRKVPLYHLEKAQP